MARLLNIGCGSIYHKDWINIDFNSKSKDVINHNILKGLPFESNSIDVIYNSSVLEHFSKSDGEALMKEISRVLKPKGIVRFAIPNMEEIARIYLDKLEEVQSNKDAEIDYDWMILEFVDQFVRTNPGGEMASFLIDNSNNDFVKGRIGQVAEAYFSKEKEVKLGLLKKIRAKGVVGIFKYIYHKASRKITNTVIKFFYGQATLTVFEEALFRSRGEVHKWMYDKFSLDRLLRKHGFSQNEVQTAETSNIPNFVNYELDTLKGKVRKPDSLYMEGILG